MHMTQRRVGFFAAFLLLGCVNGATVFGAAETVIVPIAEDGVQRLELLVDSNFFKPNRLAVRQNIAVELIFKSESVIVPHNFVLKSPESGLNIESEIGPRETAVVRFTPTRVGEFHFSCTKKLLLLR